MHLGERSYQQSWYIDISTYAREMLSPKVLLMLCRGRMSYKGRVGKDGNG
jgi:hypothetical protein